jgi:hypothetical protein
MQIKKIIAREGLILLGFIVVGVSGYLIINFRYDLIRVGEAGCLFLILGYPIYLIMRFILWAMKTVKK